MMKKIFSDAKELERYGFIVEKEEEKLHIKGPVEDFYVEPNRLVFNTFTIPFKNIKFGVASQNRVFVEIYFDEVERYFATLFLLR